MSDVCVLIPMFNKAEYTDKCVELTLKNAGMDVDIAVIDDGSEVQYFNEWVSLVRLKKNVGFSSAINAGIVYAQKKNYEFVHILNNDTEPHKDFIKILYDGMIEDEEIGIAASSRQMVTDSAYNVELNSADLLRGFQNVSSENEKLPNDIPSTWIALASALMRMDMIREIGLFDKRMINWCSDCDMCLRAGEMGWKVVLFTKSRVLHYHQTTTGKTVGTEKEKLVEADQMVFLKRITGFYYAELMREIPLDYTKKTYGKLSFEVETR